MTKRETSKSERIRSGVHFDKLADLYITPALVFTIHNTPVTWDQSSVFHATRLFGLRCRFIMWDLSFCLIVKGKQVPKPKSVLEQILDMKSDWKLE